MWVRLHLKARVMGVGDSADDGQAESVAVWVASPVLDQPLERFEEPLGLVGWHRRSGVGDRQDGVIPPGFRADLYAAVGDVVPDRVVEEVGGHSFGQIRVAAHNGVAE